MRGLFISALLCAVGVPLPVAAHAAAPAPKTKSRIDIRVEPAPKAELTPATLRKTSAKARPVTVKPVTAKMDTVLRCREGVCLQVSTKTTVSGSAPVTDD